MPLTTKQRTAFFKLATTAYNTQQPDCDFNTWRKNQMMQAGLPKSLKKVSKLAGFDCLMLHFSILAENQSMVDYYRQNERRFLLHILQGLSKDVDWLAGQIFIGSVSQMPFNDYNDCTVDELRKTMFNLGASIDNVCFRHNIQPHMLPSAAAPYYLRGRRAAAASNKLQF